MPKGIAASAPVSATLEKIAPKAMKAPPSTPSVSSVTLSCPALATPSASALAAISGGSRPSIPASAPGRVSGTQPPSAIRPMICTAMTFTIVAEGKIIA